MRTVRAVAQLQLRIIRNDPWFLLVMFGMPLVVMPLFKQTMSLSLVDSGFDGASGAEHVVPGQVVLFGFFVGGSVGFSLFREHGWNTWDRLRSSATRPATLLLGFGLPWVLILLVWQLTLFLAGSLALGLRLNGGSAAAIVLVAFAYSCVVISLVLLLATVLRTIQQMSAAQNVGAMLFGGLGGALVPIEQLPGPAQAIAPVTPAYWAMDGFRSVLLEAGGIVDVLRASTVMLGAAVILGALASLRFKDEESKQFFA
ncbi:MAG: ABC transporter permease [Actinomycetia bacterium]|nr:ABC transporter permease [Actinomycetes bacterium]